MGNLMGKTRSDEDSMTIKDIGAFSKYKIQLNKC